MAEQSQDPDFLPPRKDRLIQEHVHDAYQTRSKLPDPTVCPRCGVVYHEGRWQWLRRPSEAHEHLCPACHRIEDRYPAGSVTLTGGFLEIHKQEILNLARNQEALEKGEHALARIIEIIDGDEGVQITTTDPHLARRIGEAVRHAYAGELDFHYADETNLLRVSWTR